jgi:hypothetical protein
MDNGRVHDSGRARVVFMKAMKIASAPVNFGAPSENVVDLMQKQGGSVDPSFQFYDLDARPGARRPLTAREDIIRMLRDVPLQQSRRLTERLKALIADWFDTHLRRLH